MFLLLLACASPESDLVAEDIDNAPDLVTAEFEAPQPSTSCDDQNYGLSLTSLSEGWTVNVTVINDEHEAIYSEIIAVDECGRASPFRDVTADDLWGEDFEIDSTVYALASDSSYYEFTGVYIEEDSDAFPVSTQWEWSDDVGDFVAIRDPTYGINVGPFMIP